MRIRVLYFGMLKEAAGKSEQNVELRAGSRVSDLMIVIHALDPGIRKFEKIIAISVNQEFAKLDHILTDGDEVGLLPPVSGGKSHRVSIQLEPIDQAKILREIKMPQDGAVSLFDGIVRNNSRGRQTQYLLYEAYEVMALKQMEELAAKAIKQFKVRDIRIVHRLGRLEVSETSILIAVASAHRAQAMDACRWLIDTVKKTVPIWKKEFFADGAVWVDGGPFPDELIPRISHKVSANKRKTRKTKQAPTKRRKKASK